MVPPQSGLLVNLLPVAFFFVHGFRNLFVSQKDFPTVENVLESVVEKQPKDPKICRRIIDFSIGVLN